MPADVQMQKIKKNGFFRRIRSFFVSNCSRCITKQLKEDALSLLLSRTMYNVIIRPNATIVKQFFVWVDTTKRLW